MSTWTSRCYITSGIEYSIKTTVRCVCICVCVNQLKIEIGIETVLHDYCCCNTHLLVSVRLNADTVQKSYLNAISNALYYTHRYIGRSVDRMSARPAIVNVLYEFWANTSFIRWFMAFFFSLPRNNHFMKNWDDNRQREFSILCHCIETNVPMKFVATILFFHLL